MLMLQLAYHNISCYLFFTVSTENFTSILNQSSFSTTYPIKQPQEVALRFF